MAFDAEVLYRRDDGSDRPALIAGPGERLVHLSRGYVALIDEVDWVRVCERLWHAHFGRNSIYARNRKVGYLHQLIVSAAPGVIVDHRNRNGLDCRRANLRVAGFDQNAQNAEYQLSETGYRGVVKTRQGRYRARIKFQGKTHDCGTYKDLIDAARAYDAKALELFGEFAWVNLDNRIMPPLTMTEPPPLDIPF